MSVQQLARGIAVLPLRTPTLPPATHTNHYIVGEGELTVFDPASPYEDEQASLWAYLASRLDQGERVTALVLTHHHHDHVSGALDLAARLKAHGHDVPIVGHPANAPWLPEPLQLSAHWQHGEQRQCGGVTLHAHHTPGHAPGHLAFHDPASGALIIGDLVAGVGTIAIAPHDGDLGQYLASLDAMRTLKPTALLPAHGPVITEPEALLSHYIAHRHARSDQIARALHQHGPASPQALVPRVYPDLDPRAYPLAAAQIHSHLRWLTEQARTQQAGTNTWAAP